MIEKRLFSMYGAPDAPSGMVSCRCGDGGSRSCAEVHETAFVGDAASDVTTEGDAVKRGPMRLWPTMQNDEQ